MEKMKLYVCFDAHGNRVGEIYDTEKQKELLMFRITNKLSKSEFVFLNLNVWPYPGSQHF